MFSSKQIKYSIKLASKKKKKGNKTTITSTLINTGKWRKAGDKVSFFLKVCPIFCERYGKVVPWQVFQNQNWNFSSKQFVASVLCHKTDMGNWRPTGQMPPMSWISASPELIDKYQYIDNMPETVYLGDRMQVWVWHSVRFTPSYQKFLGSIRARRLPPKLQFCVFLPCLKM